MKLFKFLATILLVLGMVGAVSATTVSGTVTNGGPLPNALLSFSLQNCTGTPSSSLGGSVPTTFNLVANGSGLVSGFVTGNDTITCSGVTGFTYYKIRVYSSSGVLQWERIYQITGSTWDIGSATPLNLPLTNPTVLYNPLAVQGDMIVANSFGAPSRLPLGANGLCLTSNGISIVWGSCAGGSSGSVTSIDLIVPSFLTVSGGPITTSGTITLGLDTSQAANRMLATPDGAPGALAVRALVAADIPSLNASKITAGLLSPDRVLGTVTNNKCVHVDGSGVLTVSAQDCGTAGSPTGTGFTHNTSGAQDVASELVNLTSATHVAANQGTLTTVLHGNASGQASWAAIDLTADVSGILPGTGGGTGNGFTAFTGPSASLKTFTLPNASATILTTNTAVTVPQGGTGVQTLSGIVKANTTSPFTAAAFGDVVGLWTTCTAGYLKFDGSCSTPGGSGTPGGSDTYVQINDGGVFGGDSLFTYDKVTHTLSLQNLAISGAITGSGSDPYLVLNDNASPTISSAGTIRMISSSGVTKVSEGGGAYTVVGKVSASMTTNGVAVATAAGAIASTTAGTSGQCLISGGSGAAPTFQTCPGGSATSIATDATQAGKIIATGISTPGGTPSAGTGYIYFNSTSKKLCSKDDAGTETCVGGSGAPSSVKYLTNATDGTLSAEMVLTPGNGLRRRVGETDSDGGTFTVDVAPDPTILQMVEEFASGAASTSNQIGALGWTLGTISGTAVGSAISSTWPNLGIEQVCTTSTSPAAGQGDTLKMFGATVMNAMSTHAPWEVTWIANITSTASIRWRIGMNDQDAIQPSNGLWFRYDTNAGDTQLQYCVSKATAETCATTGVTPSASQFYRMKFTSTTNGKVLFDLWNGTTGASLMAQKTICATSGGCDIEISGGIPTLSAGPSAVIVTDTTAQKCMQADYFAYRVGSLTR